MSLEIYIMQQFKGVRKLMFKFNSKSYIYTYILKINGESVIDCLIDAIADVLNSQ